METVISGRKMNTRRDALFAVALVLSAGGCRQSGTSGRDEKVRAKIRPVVECSNRVLEHFTEIAPIYREDVRRLSNPLDELAPFRNPDGSFFYIGLDEHGVNYLTACANGLDAASKLSPNMEDLDAPARDTAAALRSLIEPGKQMDEYFAQHRYRDDQFAEGRQLDATITPLLNRIVAGARQLADSVQREERTVRQHGLEAINAQEGHSLRWHTQQTVMAARAMNEKLDDLYLHGRLDPASAQTAIQPLQSAFDDTEAYLEAHPEEAKSNSGPAATWSQMEHSVAIELSDTKELRELLSTSQEPAGEQRRQIQHVLQNVRSSFNEIVNMYNTAVQTEKR